MTYIIPSENITSNQIKKDNVCFCAVYFLLKENKIVYIGQTTRGMSRIEDHVRERKKDFDSYSIFKLDRELLNDAEIENILYHKPIYNKNYFGTKYITTSSINMLCYKYFGERQMRIIKKVIKDLNKRNEIIIKKVEYSHFAGKTHIDLIMKSDTDLIMSEIKKYINN